MRKLRISKRALILGLLLVLIAGGVILAYYANVQTGTGPTQTAGSVKYPGPTAQDKAYNNNHKQALAQQQTTQPSSGLQQATPVITNAGQTGQQVTVNAYVSGVFEDGGVCTATFERDGAQFTKQVTAFTDATTTDCPPITVDRSAFTSGGNWQVTVSYKSAKASGVSQPQVILIQ